MRQVISSSLFTGASFSVNTEHLIDAIKSIPGAIAIYPIYFASGPQYFENYWPIGRKSDNQSDSISAHKLTGVDRVHKELKNFGKGVRIAIIDNGIDYYHPALGGCFGPDCKVAFGYVGDEFSGSHIIPEPDDDPLDNCTHIAGILAANATEIVQTNYSPLEPFIGVAPQATIGAYRIFGCSENGTTTDLITAAIYRAFEDKADIITMSVGSMGSYAERSDAVAVKRVSKAGVYVVCSMGNDGRKGLQTGANPAIAKDAIAVGSVDNSYEAQLYLITPNGEKIFYIPGIAYGGWRSTICSTIVVNDPQATSNDGCSGPSKPVEDAVVLYAVSRADTCNSTVRCNKAAEQGAIGCLLYNIDSIIGSSVIPSGSISLEDGQSIIKIVTENSSAIFTFTNMLEFNPMLTVGAPSPFTSLGLTSDLLFKPQISGIGGYVYSTISSYAAQNQYLTNAYASYSGTSMACPYVAGTLALYLSQIGNPAPETVNKAFNNGTTHRPSISEVLNLFQSNANPVNIYNSTLLASTVQQGAGLVNAFQALTATTIISPSELALNDTTVHIWPEYFQLDPGQSRTVTLKFHASDGANPNFLPIYSGFIDVANDVDEKVVHVPYAGVVGNYSDARILVRNNPQGFITGIVGDDGYYITDGQELNITAAGVFLIILVTAWASRTILVEVVSAENNGLPELDL
ncbi:unnamed protein product, partial [Rotaria sp. Silwood1]